MRLGLFAAGLVASLALVAGCGQRVVTGVADPVSPAAGGQGVTSSPVAVPPQPQPAASGACPFLHSQDVSYDTGQHVGSVKVSQVPDGQTYPMCFFYKTNGQLEVTARVYTGSPSVATALVNQAAPIATSNPADQPAGWTGGALGSSSGSVYAVAKGGTAVIVTSDRMQTIYCRLIATTVTTYLAAH